MGGGGGGIILLTVGKVLGIVAGHPARSAARLCVEIEWEIKQILHPKFKQTEVWDCPLPYLAASS